MYVFARLGIIRQKMSLLSISSLLKMKVSISSAHLRL